MSLRSNVKIESKDLMARRRLTLIERALGKTVLDSVTVRSDALFTRVELLETRLKQLECSHKRTKRCEFTHVAQFEFVCLPGGTVLPCPGTAFGTRTIETCEDCDKQLSREFVADEEE